MPELNWDAFGKLPGSAESNFEMLCRALVRRQYGQYGDFRALASQPGVEFHLKLHTQCSLGDPGRWYGWQCRWYDLPSGRAIGSSRRKKIKEAIAKTEKELPNLTDWVLWTRHPLTKGDQSWFFKLKTKMLLTLWTADDVEAHLTGEAGILRSTYFGELVLTPDNLTKLHAAVVAAVQRRWHPEVHQTVDAERVLRRILGETESWNDLQQLADQLESDVTKLADKNDGLIGALSDTTDKMVKLAHAFATSLAVVHAVLSRGDLDLLRQQLANRPPYPTQDLAELPRKLRACRHPASLHVTNMLANIREAHALLGRVDRYLGKMLIAIVADAGCGKTQLAAQLTSATGTRPAGILLHGRDLGAGGTLDDLARRVIIQVEPVPSMHALVAALDAAGQRAHQRLPIVIDGLNEAEDPRDWKALLGSLNETLRDYPYVLVICTLRTAFADEALPSDSDRLEIPDFGQDTVEAIRRYFRHYRINAVDAELPIELLKTPLTLHIFCEVTNPTREREVGIEAIPSSLTALFDLYIERATERIAELAPRTRRYYEQDVRLALDEIGTALWEQHARGIDEHDLRRRLGDDVRPWNESIIRALEQEGIILRIPGKSPGATRVTGVYDALAGHLVAGAILSRIGHSELEKWVKETTTLTALTGTPAERHSLATDIFRSLVGLVPRRHHRQQLWPLLDEPLRTTALLEAADLEGAFLDRQTVEALAAFVAKPPASGERDLLGRLWHTRGARDHPLNAQFLDGVLRQMTMVNRDLRWTEWIRRISDELITDLRRMDNRWQIRTDRDIADQLRAQWIMWTLTSTVRNVRDHATRALYWFGRGDPARLFDLTISALTINDPYVPERMLAASYGVAMASHTNKTNPDFVNKTLPKFALDLYREMFAKDAPHSTTHALMRDFARHTIQLAVLRHPALLNASEHKRIVPPFSDGGSREWGNEKDRNRNEYREGNAPIQMDFENYTIGQLVPDRHNYQFEHEGYQKALGNIYWRLYALGYSLDAFGEIDKHIASLHWSSYSQRTTGRVDRYGKKYSWIAFFELYGLHYDQGLLKGEYTSHEERPTDVDIDPSFPDAANDVKTITADWLGNRKHALSTWIEHGETPEIRPYLLIREFGDARGPWILLDGFIKQVDQLSKRALFAFPRAIVVPKSHSREIQRFMARQIFNESRLPSIPKNYYTFAGEIPWCDSFPKNEPTDLAVPIGHRTRRVTHTTGLFYRDGIQLADEEVVAVLEKLRPLLEEKNVDQLVTEFMEAERISYRVIKKSSKILEEVSKTIPVLIPVRENVWESSNSSVNPARSVIVPAREIAELFRLSLRLPSWNTYDENGKLASISIKWGDPWQTGHHLCYLRKDILDKFLRRNHMALIWAFSGAREIWWSGESYPDPREKFKHWRKEFQRVYRYNNGRIVAGEISEQYP